MQGRDTVEWQLSMGASRWEAMDDSVKKAIKTAMMPLLNQVGGGSVVTVSPMGIE